MEEVEREIIKGDPHEMLRALKALGSTKRQKLSFPLKLTIVSSNYDNYLVDRESAGTVEFYRQAYEDGAKKGSTGVHGRRLNSKNGDGQHNAAAPYGYGQPGHGRTNYAYDERERKAMIAK